MSGEKKFDLANLAVETDSRSLAATTNAQWFCEQGGHQLKEQPGLDQFE